MKVRANKQNDTLESLTQEKPSPAKQQGKKIKSGPDYYQNKDFIILDANGDKKFRRLDGDRVVKLEPRKCGAHPVIFPGSKKWRAIKKELGIRSFRDLDTALVETRKESSSDIISNKQDRIEAIQKWIGQAVQAGDFFSLNNALRELNIIALEDGQKFSADEINQLKDMTRLRRHIIQAHEAVSSKNVRLLVAELRLAHHYATLSKVPFNEKIALKMLKDLVSEARANELLQVVLGTNSNISSQEPVVELPWWYGDKII